MFFDAESRRIQVDHRIEALRRDYPTGTSALGRAGGRLTAALRLPFAAAELEAAPGALPRPVTPIHRCSTPPARLDRHTRGI
jgi:hypothetical protein